MGAGGSVVTNPQSVVVVGAGFAGAHFVSRLVAKKWLRRFKRVVLIERRDALHHCLSSCRAVVQDGWADGQHLFFSYSNIIARAEKQAPAVLSFVQGTVTCVSDGRVDVVTADGELEHVDFDTLVVATGSRAPFPAKDDEVSSKLSLLRYQAALAATAASHRIAIVGGGPVGVELAGEIAFAYPGKDVTVFHAGAQLLSGAGLKPDLGRQLADGLRGVGVNLVLGERVDIEALNSVGRDESKTAEGGLAHLPDVVTTGPVMISTEAGTAWEADLVFRCTGTTCSSDPFNEGWLAGCLASDGRLRVNEFLQVVGHSNVYAIGDCASGPDLPLMYSAVQQGRYVAAALAKLALNKAAVVKPYQKAAEFMLVPLGPKAGCGQLPTGQVVSTGSVIALSKGKSLLVEQTRAALFCG